VTDLQELGSGLSGEACLPRLGWSTYKGRAYCADCTKTKAWLNHLDEPMHKSHPAQIQRRPHRRWSWKAR